MSQLQDVAFYAQQYKQQYETGQLSGNEYKELIDDLNIMGHINAAADDLTQNEEAYKILMSAISIAQMI
jgi:hypothetical protein